MSRIAEFKSLVNPVTQCNKASISARACSRAASPMVLTGKGEGGRFCQWQSKRETGEMQERVAEEHQTPVFSNGFGVPHAILGKAQLSFAVLIKGLNRPALQIAGDDTLGIPLHSIGDQHHP